jgi:hypothetical protein
MIEFILVLDIAVLNPLNSILAHLFMSLNFSCFSISMLSILKKCNHDLCFIRNLEGWNAFVLRFVAILMIFLLVKCPTFFLSILIRLDLIIRFVILYMLSILILQ